MASLLDFYAQRGVRFSKHGEKLHISAIPGVLTLEMQAEIKSRREEILSCLSIYTNYRETVLKPSPCLEKTCSPIFEQVRTGEQVSQSIYKINIAPLQRYYPDSLPQNICEWIISAVMAASTDEQSVWWQQLRLWAVAGESDWHWSVCECLKQEWQKQHGYRLDFLFAQAVFRGHGMQVISYSDQAA